jgi:hypothetical protein
MSPTWQLNLHDYTNDDRLIDEQILTWPCHPLRPFHLILGAIWKR